MVGVEISKCDASAFILSQDFFGYLGSLWFHFSISLKIIIEILISIALNLSMTLVYMGILIVLHF